MDSVGALTPYYNVGYASASFKAARYELHRVRAAIHFSRHGARVPGRKGYPSQEDSEREERRSEDRTRADSRTRAATRTGWVPCGAGVNLYTTVRAVGRAGVRSREVAHARIGQVRMELPATRTDWSGYHRNGSVGFGDVGPRFLQPATGKREGLGG